MLSINEIKTIPKLMHSREVIILISHMRAYTSLIGHILGSNPEIEGYYEMHKGYYSWKSIYHAKLLYYANHDVKRTATYLFDKVLHNEHAVTESFLHRADVTPLLSIRNPADTVLSIVSHYRKNDLSNEFCNIDYSLNYYCSRLIEIKKISQKIKNKYIYFDAESITRSTSELLAFLSKELGLKQSLSSNYKRMEKTGARWSGDNSESLFSGKILHEKKNNTEDLIINQEYLNKLNDVYNQTRDVLIANSRSCLLY